MAKTKKSTKGNVRICPKCKYADVSLDNTGFLQKMEIAPCVYICNRCGHSGYVFPVVDSSELSSFEKDANRKHLRLKDTDKVEAVNTAYWGSRRWTLISYGLVLVGVLIAVMHYPDRGLDNPYWNIAMTLLAVGLIAMYLARK